MGTLQIVAEAVMREHWPCWAHAASTELRASSHWPTAVDIARVALMALNNPTTAGTLREAADLNHVDLEDDEAAEILSDLISVTLRAYGPG